MRKEAQRMTPIWLGICTVLLILSSSTSPRPLRHPTSLVPVPDRAIRSSIPTHVKISEYQQVACQKVEQLCGDERHVAPVKQLEILDDPLQVPVDAPVSKSVDRRQHCCEARDQRRKHAMVGAARALNTVHFCQMPTRRSSWLHW